MAEREREYDDAEGSLDPELLYMKEYCIGSWCCAIQKAQPDVGETDNLVQAAAALARSTKGTLNIFRLFPTLVLPWIRDVNDWAWQQSGQKDGTSRGNQGH